MYFVELSIRAQDFLEKLDKDIKERIEKRLKLALIELMGAVQVPNIYQSYR